MMFTVVIRVPMPIFVHHILIVLTHITQDSEVVDFPLNPFVNFIGEINAEK